MIPPSWMSTLLRERTEPSKPASQASITPVVTASTGIAPNAGSRWTSIVER
jgi:hypothetical protein